MTRSSTFECRRIATDSELDRLRTTASKTEREVSEVWGRKMKTRRRTEQPLASDIARRLNSVCLRTQSEEREGIDVALLEEGLEGTATRVRISIDSRVADACGNEDKAIQVTFCRFRYPIEVRHHDPARVQAVNNNVREPSSAQASILTDSYTHTPTTFLRTSLTPRQSSNSTLSSSALALSFSSLTSPPSPL